MTAATTGIWNHSAQAASPFSSNSSGAHAMAGASGNSSNSGDSSTDGATISANDFLTLLVTEMQNQDPTADTDPNEYINQLVNVNSLEQLISINQTLSTAYPSTTSSSQPSATNPSASAVSAHAPTSAASKSTHAAQANAAQLNALQSNATQPVQSSGLHVVSGNFSTPDANPSALRVARALDHPRITR